MTRTFHRDRFAWLAYLSLAFYAYFLNVLGLNRWAKATCSADGSPSASHDESASADFHELSQEFISSNISSCQIRQSTVSSL